MDIRFDFALLLIAARIPPGLGQRANVSRRGAGREQARSRLGCSFGAQAFDIFGENADSKSRRKLWRKQEKVQIWGCRNLHVCRIHDGIWGSGGQPGPNMSQNGSKNAPQIDGLPRGFVVIEALRKECREECSGSAQGVLRGRYFTIRVP